MNSVSENTTIQILKDIENLSERSFNVCYYSGLNTISDIVQFYKENGTFIKLRNCGQKSNQELLNIAEKYFDYSSQLFPPEEIPEPILDELQEIFNTLNTKQKIILNNIFNSLLGGLSVRPYNALQKYLSNNFTFSNYYNLIIKDKSFSFDQLKNVGETTISELEKLNSDIIDYFRLISSFKTEKELNHEYLNSLLDNHFNIDSNHKKLINLDSYGDIIPLFRVLNVLIDNEYLFDHNKTAIFKRGFDYCVNYKFENLEEIACLISLSRERVRQLRNDILEELPKRLSFITNFDNSQLNLYEIDIDSDLIIVNDNLHEEILQNECVNFNKVFLNKIFSILFSTSHSLIGNEEDIFFNNTNRNSHNWSSTYLIKKQFLAIFDFVKFIEDVSRRLRDKIPEDYTFNFKSYLTEFFLDFDIKLLDKISDLCEMLIISECSIIIDTEDNIVFKRNTHKPVPEYIIELLEEKQKPLTVYELFDILDLKYPGLCKSPEAIRGNCQRESNKRLIFFGRTSTYGLKEWETQYDNIKGGTIRDLAVEYLLQFNEPKHINEITEYINKYRDTNSKNIHYNLRAEENNRFVFYRNWIVGLKSKDYPNFELEQLDNIESSRRSWDECLSDLWSFIKENNRMPNSFYELDESKHYRFFYNQFKRYKSGKLSEVQNIKIKELLDFIESTFNSTDQVPKIINHRTAYNNQPVIVDKEKSVWENILDELQVFRAFNPNRWPSSTRKDETQLQRRYSRLKKAYQQGILSTEIKEKINLLELDFELNLRNSWWENFELLREFRQKNPNRWPQNNNEENKLYTFCYNALKLIENKKIESDKLAALRSIDFSFTVNQKTSWVDNYNKLKEYVNFNKTFPFHIKEGSNTLYYYCRRIRNEYENGLLDDEQIQLLNDINFPLSDIVSKNSWHRNYYELVEFRKHNPGRWPKARGIETEKHLYQFCFRNRVKYNENSLSEDKLELLKRINFNFSNYE
jgi:hypothetical protein